MYTIPKGIEFAQQQKDDMEHIKRVQQVFGPGILIAAAAIGVSHLVQSTRAGADFGFQLIVLILLR